MRELVEVADGVLVATSRKYATTSTVIVSGERAVLIDPAWEPDELTGLADALAARGLTVSAGLSTHAHHDHLLWHPRFGDVPRFASARTAALAVEHRTELLASLGPGWPSELVDLFGRVVPAPTEPLSTGDDSIVLVVHDGHAPGHTALWLPDRKVLVAGDMLSDIELPLPLDPDDLGSYLSALEILAPYVGQAELVIPGHGHPTNRPRERLEADRQYLDALIAGGDPADGRRDNEDMATVHQRNLALAADFGR